MSAGKRHGKKSDRDKTGKHMTKYTSKKSGMENIRERKIDDMSVFAALFPLLLIISFNEAEVSQFGQRSLFLLGSLQVVTP